MSGAWHGGKGDETRRESERGLYGRGYEGIDWSATREAAAKPAPEPEPKLVKPDHGMGGYLANMGELIRTQNNRITDSPIFIVQQKRRIYGIEDGYCNSFVWIDGENSYTDEEKVARDAERAENEEPEAEYRQCGYIDIWEFVTACFTEQGCKDYLRQNAHNLREPRIYAEGSFRNTEWRTVRSFLMGLPPTVTELPEPAFRLRWNGTRAAYFVNKPDIGDTDVYTADQMYVALALSPPKERTGTVADIADDELMRRAVRNIARNKGRREFAWAAVMEAFGLGSTYSHQLCLRFGIDPDSGKDIEPG